MQSLCIVRQGHIKLGRCNIKTFRTLKNGEVPFNISLTGGRLKRDFLL